MRTAWLSEPWLPSVSRLCHSCQHHALAAWCCPRSRAAALSHLWQPLWCASCRAVSAQCMAVLRWVLGRRLHGHLAHRHPAGGLWQDTQCCLGVCPGPLDLPCLEPAITQGEPKTWWSRQQGLVGCWMPPGSSLMPCMPGHGHGTAPCQELGQSWPAWLCGGC